MPGKTMSYKLNEKEQKVFDAFPKDKSFVTLSDLAGKAFGSKRGTSPKSRGNSWVRNSLRKLVSLKLVKFKGARSGEYCLTGNSMPEAPPPKPQKVSKKKAASSASSASKPKKKKATKSSKKNGDSSKDKGEGKDLEEESETNGADLKSSDDDDDSSRGNSHDDEDETSEEAEV